MMPYRVFPASSAWPIMSSVMDHRLATFQPLIRLPWGTRPLPHCV